MLVDILCTLETRSFDFIKQYLYRLALERLYIPNLTPKSDCNYSDIF